MCLGIPSKIIELDETLKTGKVDHLGTKVQVSFALMEGLRPGDWVIVHAGFAISRLDEKEARVTLALLREIEESAPSGLSRPASSYAD